MKYLTTLLLLLLPALAARADGEGAAIQFAEKAYDFGTIAEQGGPVSHEFEFTNTGDAPLMILNATASCGCTRPRLPQKARQSRQKRENQGDIPPRRAPRRIREDRNGEDQRQAPKKVTLRIKGFVNPDAR